MDSTIENNYLIKPKLILIVYNSKITFEIMRKIGKIHLIPVLLILLIVGCGGTKEVMAQQPTDEEQIVGTWIPEGSPHVRLVFTSDGTLKKYKNDNELYKTYNWTMEERQSPSGLTFSILVLINVQDADDKIEYLVDTVSDDRLVLVYNTGIGMSRIPYNRQ